MNQGGEKDFSRDAIAASRLGRAAQRRQQHGGDPRLRVSRPRTNGFPSIEGGEKSSGQSLWISLQECPRTFQVDQ
jgi:hypothetical protein